MKTAENQITVISTSEVFCTTVDTSVVSVPGVHNLLDIFSLLMELVSILAKTHPGPLLLDTYTNRF